MIPIAFYTVILAPVLVLLWAIHPALVVVLIVALMADVAWRVVCRR